MAESGNAIQKLRGKAAVHRFLGWAPPSALTGLLAVAALGGESVRAIIWDAIVAACTDPVALPVVLALTLLWALAWWFTRDKEAPASVPGHVLPIASPAREIPIWKAVRHVSVVIGDTTEKEYFAETRRLIRQAALKDKIHLTGRRELEPPHPPGYSSPVWSEIAPQYWIKHEINEMAVGEFYRNHSHTNAEPMVIDGYRNRYWALMANEAEIESVWGKAPPPEFDTPFALVIDRVAIRSEWAAAVNPACPDWQRLLSKEILRPLASGTIQARGIRTTEAGEENGHTHIPVAFWINSKLQLEPEHIFAEQPFVMNFGDGVSYHDIRFRRREVEDEWPVSAADEFYARPSPFREWFKTWEAEQEQARLNGSGSV